MILFATAADFTVYLIELDINHRFPLYCKEKEKQLNKLRENYIAEYETSSKGICYTQEHLTAWYVLLRKTKGINLRINFLIKLKVKNQNSNALRGFLFFSEFKMN